MNNNMSLRLIVVVLATLFSWVVNASVKVDRDLTEFDQHIEGLTNQFAIEPINLNSKKWVKLKLAHMVKVDQYMRSYISTPAQKKYNASEEKYFREKFQVKWQKIDEANTQDLKKLLKIHGWFKVSTFDKEADQNAWLLVQHADHDLKFQKNILVILEKLLNSKDTKPANYAYLYDRVAVSREQKIKLKQRYGTQGKCVAKGLWEPDPIEDIVNVNKLRASVGLESIENYKSKVKDLCQ